MYKFPIKHPANEDEKKIVSLTKELQDVTYAWISLNFNGPIGQAEFNILMDATVGYAGSMAQNLAKIIDNREQKIYFLGESKEIYSAYIDSIKENL